MTFAPRDLHPSNQVKSSVIIEFLDWIKRTYGRIGRVKITRGKRYDYFRMTLEYKDDGMIVVDMTLDVQSMIESFPKEELLMERQRHDYSGMTLF
jgi:hypothetical protein